LNKNVGSWDKIVRVGMAVIFGLMIALGAVEGTSAIILGILAVVFLVTSAAGFCPLYMPLHKSTVGKE
jgi:hypothetical protein